MAYEIFISYSNRDAKTAEAVCAALEAKNLHCWIAPRDILPGLKYAEAIIDGINQCEIFLLVLSGASNDSSQVEMEVERAVSKDKTILSFRIEDVTLSKSLEYYLSSRHWLDASRPPVETHLQLLINTIEQLLAADKTALIPQTEASSVETISSASEIKPTKKKFRSDTPVLTPSHVNPFSFGNPIKDPERFYGRQAEIRQIVNRLLSSAHESTSIVGERRIGKTSLLCNLANPGVAASLTWTSRG